MTTKRRHWFWGTLAASWKIYRDVLVASFLINVLGLVTPFFILNVYDRVIPNNAFETLWVLAIGISITYVFGAICHACRKGHTNWGASPRPASGQRDCCCRTTTCIDCGYCMEKTRHNPDHRTPVHRRVNIACRYPPGLIVPTQRP